MKILVVSNMYPNPKYPSYGVFVANFCAQLEDLGVGYRLCAMKKHPSRLGKALGYLAFYLSSFFLSLFGTWDAVYIHYASHSSPGVLLARKLKQFTVYTNVHGSDVMPENAKQEKFQYFTRRILALSQKIIVPSAYFARCVGEKYGICPEKLHVCPSGGVDVNNFYPRETVSNPVFTFGTVGRISHGKGWDTLLQACAAMPDRNYRLIIAGDGPERGAMEDMLRTLHLEENVRLLGTVSHSQLPEIYSSLDVFVFPTRRDGESLGLVAVEAMACGTPVIASDYAAPADYVKSGFNGEKFPVGDGLALRDALVSFRALPEETRKRLSQGALATAASYSRTAATTRLKEILNA